MDLYSLHTDQNLLVHAKDRQSSEGWLRHEFEILDNVIDDLIWQNLDTSNTLLALDDYLNNMDNDVRRAVELKYSQEIDDRIEEIEEWT